MVELTPFDLGTAGRDYMLDCLDQSTAFSPAAMARVRERGHFSAPLPIDTTDERARQFTAGWITDPGKPLAWLCMCIARIMGSDALLRVLVEDCWARPDDSDRVLPGVERHVVDGNVCYALAPGVCHVDALVALFRSPLSFQVNGFVGPATGADSTIQPDIAARSQLIFVNAYDQEGLVVWREDAR